MNLFLFHFQTKDSDTCTVYMYIHAYVCALTHGLHTILPYIVLCVGGSKGQSVLYFPYSSKGVVWKIRYSYVENTVQLCK